MKYNYIVFDFNGTIINDVDLCLDLLNEILESENLPKCDLDKYKHIFTFPIIEYYKKAGITFKYQSFEEIASWFVKKYQPLSFSCSLFDGVKETLISLKNRGYKLILLSASEINNLKEQTDKFNLTYLFDQILGIDDVQARSKLKIAENYFKENNVDMSKVIFIGDSLHDYEVGSYFSSDVVLVSYGHQARDVVLQSGVPVIDSIYELEKLL